MIDDFSTDGTGDIARALGVTVMRPPQNTGSKAGAQNFALPFVKTDICMAIDGDTEVAPDGSRSSWRPWPIRPWPRAAGSCSPVG